MSESVANRFDDKDVLLAESVAGVRASHPDFVLTREANPVAPGQALVDASSNASLVVAGSHGRGFFAGVLLGSVGHDVLYRPHYPVAAIR